MRNNWSIQEDEDFLQYSNRLNSELNIKNKIDINIIFYIVDK